MADSTNEADAAKALAPDDTPGNVQAANRPPSRISSLSPSGRDRCGWELVFDQLRNPTAAVPTSYG